MARCAVYLFALIVATLPLPALAEDPPERVGRVSHIEGGASVRMAQPEPWAHAFLNYPVAAGASLATPPAGRIEVQFGTATLRLDGDTLATVERLDDVIALRIDRGTAHVRVREVSPDAGLFVSTPDGRMAALAPGAYHVAAGHGGGPTRVAVLEGLVRFDLPRSSVPIAAGQVADLRADPENVYLAQAMKTMFDDWALQRDREAVQSSRHAGHLPGYEDLETTGLWQEIPDYGAVWYPRAVPAGWAPYTRGRWAWIAPWGWTWIDDQSWGFAPFHYGRWVQVDARWAWWPGFRQARPVYAPALVSFHAGNRPQDGWRPLAPREAYQPAYRGSIDHVRRINARVAPGVGPDRGRDRPVAVQPRPPAFSSQARPHDWPVREDSRPARRDDRARSAQPAPAPGILQPPPPRRQVPEPRGNHERRDRRPESAHDRARDAAPADMATSRGQRPPRLCRDGRCN